MHPALVSPCLLALFTNQFFNRLQGIFTCACMQKNTHIPTATCTNRNIKTHIHISKDKKLCYLYYFVQNSLISLILAVAEETVSVDIVRVSVQFDGHVVEPCEVVLDCEGDLGRCSTEVHGSDCLCPLWVHVGVPQVFLHAERKRKHQWGSTRVNAGPRQSRPISDSVGPPGSFHWGSWRWSTRRDLPLPLWWWRRCGSRTAGSSGTFWDFPGFRWICAHPPDWWWKQELEILLSVVVKNWILGKVGHFRKNTFAFLC